jgi:predicted TIM-barrel fold metal-dependent hydrolase
MYDPDWSAPSIAPMILAVLDAFGPERTMFGSNFPVDRLARGYDPLLNAVRDAVTEAGAELGAVMAGTARDAYRLPA